MRVSLPRALVLAIGLTLACAAQAAAFETPKTTTATQNLGSAVHGAGYNVQPVVKSDGFTRTFVIEVTGGTIAVNGLGLIRQRLREFEAVNRLERVSQSVIGQLVPVASPLRYGDDQPASAQAGQVVGEILPGDAEQVGQLRGVAGCIAKGEQQPGPGGVGQCVAEAGEDLSLCGRFHARDSTSDAVFSGSCTE